MYYSFFPKLTNGFRDTMQYSNNSFLFFLGVLTFLVRRGQCSNLFLLSRVAYTVFLRQCPENMHRKIYYDDWIYSSFFFFLFCSMSDFFKSSLLFRSFAIFEHGKKSACHKWNLALLLQVIYFFSNLIAKRHYYFVNLHQ